MPNAKVLSEKQAVVASLVERLQSAQSGILVDYKGITLVRFALDKVGLQELDSVLHGTTSLATSTEDPIAPIRVINEYASKMNGKFEIKAGFMEGRVLSMDEINSLAQLDSKEGLYAKVLGTMLAPITSLAVCLGQILEQKGGAPAEAAE